MASLSFRARELLSESLSRLKRFEPLGWTLSEVLTQQRSIDVPLVHLDHVVDRASRRDLAIPFRHVVIPTLNGPLPAKARRTAQPFRRCRGKLSGDARRPRDGRRDAGATKP